MPSTLMPSSEKVTVVISRLSHAPQQLPEYKTDGSVGMDLQAAMATPMTLNPLERALVPTGWQIALPAGYEAQVRARSGLSVKHGITLINGVGTIDWDYRDEVKVALVNCSNEPYTIEPGDRIAQLVIMPVTKAAWAEIPDIKLAEGVDRQGGFGSTGR